ncbi:MAG: hypothetical protein ABL907_00575, partial [Hyphomicrobium sp.]
IIDLGPEGGDGGGKLVAAGTPEDVAMVKASYTGQFLRDLLARRAKASKGVRPVLPEAGKQIGSDTKTAGTRNGSKRRQEAAE